jgi:hypothetical protein
MIFPDVDRFVLMLRKGTYDNMFIPAFKPEDIERLLYYAGFKRFPSRVPELIIPGGTIQQPVATITDLNRAWALYNKWWTDNKTSDFDEFRSVNPLEGAVLMWH